MEQSKKNLLMVFLELSAERGYLKDKATEKKEEIFKVVNKIEKLLPDEDKLFCELEEVITDTIEFTKHRYFDYGLLAHEIDENYQENYDPFQRVV